MRLLLLLPLLAGPAAGQAGKQAVPAAERQGQGSAGAAAAQALSDAFAEVARKASPAVVSLQVTSESRVRLPPGHEFFFGDPEDLEEFFRGRPRRPREHRFQLKGVGSGVLIRQEGLLLTNEHVVRDADEIRVTLTRPDGSQETLPARVVGSDPGLDLAVVRIEAKRSFPFLPLADSSKVRVGDWAVAIGSPFELQQTVTAGIVSAVRQSLVIEGKRFANMIQTDAAINRGNSGGPLLDLDGAVIGINTAIFSPSGASAGVGFAVPADEIKAVLPYLLQGKRVARGWLGIQVMGVDEVIQKRFGLKEPRGALVNGVFEGSPGAEAGLRRGDVIVRFGGTEVQTADDLIGLASGTPPGKAVKVEVVREGRARTLTAALAEKPEWALRGHAGPGGGPEQGPKAEAEWQGVRVAQGKDGVTVTKVAEDSKLAGYLLPGDVLQGMNDVKIDGIGSFERAAAAASLREGVVFDVVRDGQPMFISVQE